MGATAIASTEPRHRARAIFPTLTVTAWVSTVLLILIGSIVRVTGFGLGCPDWPLCYGQAIPPGFTEAWVEFSHRLFGAATSLQIFALAAIAWREYRQEHWIFRPAVIVAGLLVLQIGLGGLHVIMELPPETGLVHTGAAMMIVGLLALILARSAPFAHRLAASARASLLDGRLPALISVSTAASYLLLLTGSYVTRTGASLACLDFPLCGAVEQATQRLIDIQMLHRLTAFTVAGLIIGVVVWIFRRTKDRGLRRIALVLSILLVLQFGLGMANVFFLLPMWSRVLHITVGASIWSALVILWTITRRFAATQGRGSGAA
jgi:heme A synthase